MAQVSCKFFTAQHLFLQTNQTNPWGGDLALVCICTSTKWKHFLKSKDTGPDDPYCRGEILTFWLQVLTSRQVVVYSQWMWKSIVSQMIDSQGYFFQVAKNTLLSEQVA